ncbi:entericidin EcnA/B family protein [Roseomonas elaeocarpi]|uniref:Entericidin EcnA/B family protein n=1 Tax=Roseomonas elaeocarpi TaxID=907779 RepID=A0ABV6JU50_9PROT
MRRIFALALTIGTLLGSAGLLGACNTIAGAGQDVSVVGSTVAGSAERAKP